MTSRTSLLYSHWITLQLHNVKARLLRLDLTLIQKFYCHDATLYLKSDHIPPLHV